MGITKERREQQAKDKTYSQLFQDVFALIINDYKINGFCLDIGCHQPHWDNNTELLRLLNWKSINVDLQDFNGYWKSIENAKFYQTNMSNQESVEQILSECPPIVDYLSLDIDDETINCLKLIDLEKTRFRCITIEHNKYLGDRGEQRHLQREILTQAGYHLLIKNVGNYEDWWVDSRLVDVDKFEYLTTKYSDKHPDVDLWKLDVDVFAPEHKSKIIKLLGTINPNNS